MLRGLRNRSSTRRSPVVHAASASDEEDYVVSGKTVVKTPPVMIPKDHTFSIEKNSEAIPPVAGTNSRSTVSVTSSSDGSMFSCSADSPRITTPDDHNDDTAAAEIADKLPHENYLNGTIPDLEDILRSFGSKSRKMSNTRTGARYERKSILNTTAATPELDDLFDDDDDDDRNSHNSSYNSGFSSSSDSSYESIPDTTQIADFYNNNGGGGGELSPSSESNFVTLSPKSDYEGGDGDTTPVKSNVTLSPTSTTVDIQQFSGDWSIENVSSPHKATTSSSRSKPKRHRRRSERRKRSRLSRLNKNNHPSNEIKESESSCNDDDSRSRHSFLSRTNSLINTSKSFGKNWTRKKRIDQGAATISSNLSDTETKEKLFSVEPSFHPYKKSEPLMVATTLVTDDEGATSISSSPSTINSEPEPAVITTSSDTATTKVSISKNKISHVIERFDCDTGEKISDLLVENRVTDRHMQRSSSPTSLQGSSEGRQNDPLALRDMKVNQEAVDNELPQKSCGSSGDRVVSNSLSNVTNVIENMVLLFANSDIEGIRRLLGESLESSVSSLSTSSSTLSRIVAFDSSNDEGINMEDDGSDDKGGSDKQKAKHLRSSKLMSLKGVLKQSTKSLQQAQFATTNDYTLPLSMRGIVTHYSISILLIEPIHKIFEIVTVDVTRNTTLKETLINACLAAADPTLAEQTYISLCSDMKVLSNMSSPVSKLIQKPTDFSKKENVRSNDNNNKVEDGDKHKEVAMRREMERQLLVAVPLKSNFKECQMIRRILWKNTKLQLWWTTYQMKNEHYATPWSNNVPSSSQSVMNFPQPINI